MEDIFIGIDFEGRSQLNIGEVGATKYATDPSSSPICMGYAGMQDALRGFVNMWKAHEPFPRALAHYADLPGVVFVAHNVQFDRTYWAKQITPRFGVPVPKRWLCTAVRASANGLPRGLDEACAALGLPGKDKDGQKALKRLYAPDKKLGRFIMPEDNPDLYEAAYGYCRVDVQRMFQVLQGTRPISPDDQRYFELDQIINERGFAIDGANLDRMLDVLELCEADLVRRAAAFGLSMTDLNSPKALHEVMSLYGFSLPNLQAQTIDDALKLRKMPDDVREMLTLRRLAGLKSPGKLRAFKQYGDYDFEDDSYTIRDAYVMNGGHTGRHTSKGAQAQNLKRECAEPAEVDLLLHGDLEVVKLLTDQEPLILMGKAIRPLVRARKGKKLLIGDFAKIELCVTFWFAGHKAGLQALINGKDLYKELAAAIFNISVDKVTKEQRQLGKQGVLGAGFGIGAVKFQATCANYGMHIDLETAQKAITAYRTLHRPVAQFWKTLENAIISATNGIPQQLGPLKIAADKQQLVITLPSRRKLRYQKPSVRDGRIHFWHVDPKTHQWLETTDWGGGFTNNVVQGTANCIQREAALQLEDAMFEIVMHSHDELVAEDDEERLDEFTDIMSLKRNRPKWAEGIPIAVESKATRQYRK